MACVSPAMWVFLLKAVNRQRRGALHRWAGPRRPQKVQISKKAQAVRSVHLAYQHWHCGALAPFSRVCGTPAAPLRGSLLTEAGSSAQVEVTASPKSTKPHAFSDLQSVWLAPGPCRPLPSPQDWAMSPNSPPEWSAPQQLPGETHGERLCITPCRLGQTPKAEPRRGVNRAVPPARLQHHGQSPRRRCGTGRRGCSAHPPPPPSPPHAAGSAPAGRPMAPGEREQRAGRARGGRKGLPAVAPPSAGRGVPKRRDKTARMPYPVRFHSRLF